MSLQEEWETEKKNTASTQRSRNLTGIYKNFFFSELIFYLRYGGCFIHKQSDLNSIHWNPIGIHKFISNQVERLFYEVFAKMDVGEIG